MIIGEDTYRSERTEQMYEYDTDLKDLNEFLEHDLRRNQYRTHDHYPVFRGYAKRADGTEVIVNDGVVLSGLICKSSEERTQQGLLPAIRLPLPMRNTQKEYVRRALDPC